MDRHVFLSALRCASLSVLSKGSVTKLARAEYSVETGEAPVPVRHFSC
jgi:hypothetical protein